MHREHLDRLMDDLNEAGAAELTAVCRGPSAPIAKTFQTSWAASAARSVTSRPVPIIAPWGAHNAVDANEAREIYTGGFG
jgi:hypothetical protein